MITLENEKRTSTTAKHPSSTPLKINIFSKKFVFCVEFHSFFTMMLMLNEWMYTPKERHLENNNSWPDSGFYLTLSSLYDIEKKRRLTSIYMHSASMHMKISKSIGKMNELKEREKFECQQRHKKHVQEIENSYWSRLTHSPSNSFLCVHPIITTLTTVANNVCESEFENVLSSHLPTFIMLNWPYCWWWMLTIL